MSHLSYLNVPANDADVVGGGELLLGGVRVPRVHVVDGPPAHDDVIESLLEGPQRQVHWPHGKQGKGVDADHDQDESHVKQNL